MNFADLRFWILLISSLGGALVLRRFLRLTPAALKQYDKWCLAISGMILLGGADLLTLFIYLYVILVSWFGMRLLSGGVRKPRGGFLAIILLQVWPLLGFKYLRFLVEDVVGVSAPGFLRDLAIPVGISFYTFQAIAFTLDTLAFHKPIPPFVDWLNFLGFFPQLVAGPIERGADLLPQVEVFSLRLSWENLHLGVPWLVLGFFFKSCLADNLASLIATGAVRTAWHVWLNNALFGLRIYFDFAGYSLIAMGLARCLGIRLTLNFVSPYCSTSCVEFWRRWHVTLSNWFRDYVYLPMGGSRNPGGSDLLWMRNIFVVFLVSGIWHGAGWNFVAWGAAHAVLLILVRKLPLPNVPSVVKWGFTMGAVMLTWLFFYRTNPAVLVSDLRLLVTPSAYGVAALRETLGYFPEADLVLLLFIGCLSSLTLFLEWVSLRRGEAYSVLRWTPVTIALVVLTVLLAPTVDNGFIYFAF
ncbi:MAG: MBOAT family protein [Verrucomicrobiales bacterium]|nr:MBOAT family protein [Verrucomicrobiales bacterium]